MSHNLLGNKIFFNKFIFASIKKREKKAQTFEFPQKFWQYHVQVLLNPT
jgi:hypothetical protein